MIIKRPGSCRCGDPTFSCKIACSCDGYPHSSDCHHGIWSEVPGWVDSITTDAAALGIEPFNIDIDKGSNHMTTYNFETPMHALNYFRDLCHGTSIKAGWWKEIENLTVFMRSHGVDSRLLRFMTAQVVGTKFSLIHSEISEALEGYRKDAQDSHLPAFKSVDVELADALIRIFDLAGYLGCDLAAAVEAKMQYNRTRNDHTAAARNAPGGKQF